jgi:hypothetical protein
MRTALLLVLLVGGPIVTLSAEPDIDLSGTIQGFMAKQFPAARSAFWVINDAQWQDDNELVVDLKAVVTAPGSLAPDESRFLLLIVGGKLAAVQSVPLEAAPDCRPEQTAA